MKQEGGVTVIRVYTVILIIVSLLRQTGRLLENSLTFSAEFNR